MTEELAPAQLDLEPALRALQRHIQRHPTAFREAFAALVAEGRRFGRTPEGALWRERLRTSALLPRARRLLTMVSPSILEGFEEPEVLPSVYVDVLLRAAASEEGDTLIDRLFGGAANAG